MLKVQTIFADPLALERDALMVALWEGEKFAGTSAKIDRKLNGQLGKLREWGEVKGKLGEVTVVHTLGLMTPKRVVLVGLGKAEEIDAEKVRRAIGNAVKTLNRISCQFVSIAIDTFPQNKISASDLGRAIAEGAILANYRYLRKSDNSEAPTLESLELVTASKRAVAETEKGVQLGTVMANATNFARNLVNAPASEMTPIALAEQAKAVAEKHGLRCEVYDENWIEQVGMGALRAVSSVQISRHDLSFCTTKAKKTLKKLDWLVKA